MVKIVLVMKARRQDSGQIVIIPINSAITFALLPEDTDEVRLGASWEGTFTVAEMIRLTMLPPVGELNNGCLLYIVCTYKYRGHAHTHMHGQSTHVITHMYCRSARSGTRDTHTAIVDTHVLYINTGGQSPFRL